MADVTQAQAIWEISDIVASELGSHLTPDQLKFYEGVLNAHKIEAYKRPSPSPGVAKENGGVPGAHPKQLKFWESVQDHLASSSQDRKRILAYVAANQSGKTIAAGVAFCEHVRDRAKNGDIFWLIAQSYKSLRGVPLRTIWELLPKAMFGGRWTYQPHIDAVPTLVLDLPNGRGKCELAFKCIGPNQIIPSADGGRKVSEIRGRHRVFAWDGDKQVEAMADEPFIKGHFPCFRFTMTNGETLDATLDHRVLLEGGWCSLAQLLEVPPSFHGSGIVQHSLGGETCSLSRLNQRLFGKWAFEPSLGYGGKHVSRESPRFVSGNGVSIATVEYIGVQPIYDFHVPYYFNYLSASIYHHNTEEMDIKELESERVTGIWWTECRREAFLSALQPRLVAKGGWIVADFIPVEPWHADFIENAKIPNSINYCVAGGIVDNQHNLSAGAVNDMKPTALGGRGVMSVEEWNLRGLGLPATFEGVVYKQFNPAVHVIDPFPIPEQWPLYIGADWGLSNPHAFLLATVGFNEAKYLVSEEYSPGDTVFNTCVKVWNMVSSFRKMSCGQWGDSESMFIALRMEFNQATYDDMGQKIYGRSRKVADHIREQWRKTLATSCVIDASVFDNDQADASSLADEFEMCGFPLQPSSKGNKDGSVELVRRHFEQKRLFFFNHCFNTIKEHRIWRYKTGKDGIPDPDERYEKKNDHSCDSLRYLLKSAPCHNPPTAGIESFSD